MPPVEWESLVNDKLEKSELWHQSDPIFSALWWDCWNLSNISVGGGWLSKEISYQTDTQFSLPWKSCALYLVLWDLENEKKFQMLPSWKFKLALREVVDQRNKEVALRYEQQLKQQLWNILWNHVVYVFGSDGRGENINKWSAMTFIIVTEDDNIGDSPKENALQLIKSAFAHMNNQSTHPDSLYIEIKSKKDNMASYCASKDYEQYFPTRYLDALLIGQSDGFDMDKVIKDKYKSDIQDKLREWSTGWSQHISNSNRIINQWGIGKWKGSNIIHYDLEKWELYYAKTDEMEKWLKQWQLRFVQYNIMDILHTLMKKNNYMPNCFGMSTEEKLQSLQSYIYENYSIDISDSIKTLISTYLYMLQLHLHLQRKFNLTGRPDEGIILLLDEVWTSIEEFIKNTASMKSSMKNIKDIIWLLPSLSIKE